METDVGRQRAFFLFALSERMLALFVSSLLSSEAVLDAYYPRGDALVRSVDVRAVVEALLEVAQSLRLSVDTRRAGERTLFAALFALTLWQSSTARCSEARAPPPPPRPARPPARPLPPRRHCHPHCPRCR